MTDYHVSYNSGSNSNSGKSATAQWKSLKKGLDALSAGDTLYIHAGTYVPGNDDVDSWTISRAKGTSARPITIQNYDGGTVIIDGKGRDGEIDPEGTLGWPKNGLKLKTGKSYLNRPYYWSWSGLLNLDDCTYVTISGITIKNSQGSGLRLRGDDGETACFSKSAVKGDFTSTNITIDDCTIHDCRNRTLHINSTWDHTVSDCDLSFGSWGYGGGEANTLKNVRYAYWYRNVIHENAGEAFIADANNFPSQYIYFYNNVCFDNEGPILFHGTKYGIVASNLVYTTPQDDVAGVYGFVGGNKGITVKASECNDSTQRDSEYNAVVGNIIINRTVGITIKNDRPRAADSENPCTVPADKIKGTYNCFVVGNTAYNCDVNYLFRLDKCDDITYQNNISINSEATAHVSAPWGAINGLTSDYNLYHGSSPSLPTGFAGGNDVSSDPLMENPGNITKGAVSTQKGKFEGTFTLKTGYDDATGFRIKTASPAKNAGDSVSGPAGWAAMDDYLDYVFYFADLADQTGAVPVRDGTWDIGADEYGTAGGSWTPPTADAPAATAGVTGGSTHDVGDTISFTGSGSGGTAPLTYLWTFGDGSTSTSQNPTHEYTTVGYYTVTLRVTDDAGKWDEDIEYVTVLSGTGGGTAVIQQVLLDAGDASYAVSATPKAIVFAATKASTDDTSVNNTQMMLGIWGENGGTPASYAASLYAAHNQSTTDTYSTNAEDGVLCILDGDKEHETNLATVDSVTASAVNMSWPTAPASTAKIVSYNFCGDLVSSVKATALSLGTVGSKTSVSGNYNVAIIPCSLLAGYGDKYNRSNISYGVAFRDIGVVSHSYHNQDNQATTNIRSLTSEEHLAFAPRYQTYVDVDTWDTTEFQVVVGGNNDANCDVPVLLMNLDIDLAMGILDTPTATGNNDYTDAGIDAQLAWLFGAMNTDIDNGEDQTAASGVFNFHSVNSGGTGYTLAISSEDDVATSDESSYYSDAYDPRDSDGTSEATGALSIITDGLRIAPTTAAGTTYKNAYVLFGDTTGISDLTALFGYQLDGTDGQTENIPAGEDVKFFDLSTPHSSYAITDWDWDFDDGNTSTSQSPTHAFDEAGTYTVELEATDANATVSTHTLEVVISVPQPTVDFNRLTDVSPLIDTSPQTITVDTSGVTVGSGETIDFIRVTLTDEKSGRQYSAAGTGSIEVYVDSAGTYDMLLEVNYAGLDDPIWQRDYDNVITITDTPDTGTFAIESSVGKGRCPVGPIDITFYATLDGNRLSTDSETGAAPFASIDWDFGDGNTDTVWQPTNTFIAVSSATARDVGFTITDGEGTEHDVEETAYITIYPAQTAPLTLARLMDRAEGLEAAIYLTGTWTQEAAPNTNVWKWTGSKDWAKATITVTEDGAALSSQASVAACQANAGSAYVTFSSPTLTVYVHGADGDSPNTNDKIYRWLY